MDSFAKCPDAYALPDHEAETVAEALANNIIARFEAPRELHSDQGREFESVVFEECCRLPGIKTRTNASRPQSDGSTGRCSTRRPSASAETIGTRSFRHC